MKAKAKFYWPVQVPLVLFAYASSECLKKGIKVKAQAKFLGPVQVPLVLFAYASSECLKKGIKVKAQAKFLGPVHETYQICEQRMFWRGFTLAQSRQSLC